MDPSRQPHEIEQQQDEVLERIRQLRVVRSGTLSVQTLGKPTQGRQARGEWGPYFVWQGYRDGQHFSRRVPAAQAERYRQEIDARKQVDQLCNEYIRLGEELARALHEDRAASDEAAKKGLKSRSRRARK